MCWRVPVHFYRQDVTGRVHKVERCGPVIAARSSKEAETKAIAIFEQSLDYAGIGVASYLHAGHRGMLPVSPTLMQPAQAPEISLEESLARMAAHIRARGHRMKGRGLRTANDPQPAEEEPSKVRVVRVRKQDDPVKEEK